ncbi:metalloendoproteinase 1-MMP-like [Mercurialis annua]|uniref:metalloendoproteinase 1-MMP-like n=1 Tax=Mercurialis annua TaxID=3986 RepID=UPI0021604383|nr:metalloendoproteinase 1-MMP-like [Mercurialis annua]
MFRYFSYLFIVFLFLSRPSFSIRLTPDSTPVISTDTHDTTVVDTHNAKWHDFARFLYAEKGTKVDGMSELKKYFHRFGYLPANLNFTDFFDSEFESAILTYQTNLGLPKTGKLDSDTISTIMSPRCGFPDINMDEDTDSSLHVTEHYAHFKGDKKWVKELPMILTYSFSKNDIIDYISVDDIKVIFKSAFSRWASVVPVNFTEVEDYYTADIKIGWYSHDHGDGHPFDGVSGVLAHAFSPEYGKLHLDADETWAFDFDKVKSRVAVDLESVATHEIGHCSQENISILESLNL